MIGRGAEKKAGRESSKSSFISAQASPWGLLVVSLACFHFWGPSFGRGTRMARPTGAGGLGGRCPGVSRASGVFFGGEGERALMRTTEGVGFVWGVTGLLGPRFLVSRCVDRGPREEQEMHRWERHGRADRVFNATIPDEPRCACGPRLVDLVRGSVSGIWNLELGACSV